MPKIIEDAEAIRFAKALRSALRGRAPGSISVVDQAHLRDLLAQLDPDDETAPSQPPPAPVPDRRGGR